jgi:16S rRNA (cytidine1402-2'-O)-methyltransferase
MTPVVGTLYIIPTPVGNLEDMTYRAVRLLQEAELILCEDTRTSSVLLKRYEIVNRLQSYHKFNEHNAVEHIIKLLQEGKQIALISDAGTPGISDPGFLIVRQCVRSNIQVICLPGATAFVPALVASGLPCDRFVFEGFLPHKKGRLARLQAMQEEQRTIILYESPYRLQKTLLQLADYLGSDRQAAVCRELSKLHEDIQRGTLAELSVHFEIYQPKGEFVLVVAGR